MLESLEVRTAQGNLLVLVLDDVSSGYSVADILGLDPVKATIVSTGFAQQDIAQFQSARRESRNIVIKLGLEPDYAITTVRALRRQLYDYFMPKLPVKLTFIHDDGFTANANGYIESAEAPLFVQDPQMDISILCLDPDFYAPTTTLITGDTVSDNTEFYLPYEGTIETGIEFKFMPDRVVNSFTIYHRAPNGTMTSLEFTVPLALGQLLTLNTRPGEKSALRTLSTQDGSMLYAVSPQSIWTTLYPGDNHLRVYAEGLPVPYEIRYVERYGGL